MQSNPASPSSAKERMAINKELNDLPWEPPLNQPRRGDAVVGRTLDEEHRPLTCFVCGARFGITFNFCHEHKEEFEALRKSAPVNQRLVEALRKVIFIARQSVVCFHPNSAYAAMVEIEKAEAALQSAGSLDSSAPVKEGE